MGDFRTALGLISGTSMDGIDLALIETNGERVRAFGSATTVPYPADLRAALGAAVAAGGGTAEDHRVLEPRITDAHADAVGRFLSDHRIDAHSIDIVGFHGQTVLHRPERRLTIQLGDGAALAARLGLPVVNDFRSADVAAGGQGAPLAPLYHAALSQELNQPVCVLNLGGVGNLTYIDGKTVLAFDTGPANAMIDDWVARTRGVAYDEGGRIAAAGTVDEAALDRLLDHPYFAAPFPKSLDRNDFPPTPVEGLGAEDGAATLATFTARTVALAADLLPTRPRRWLVTGGGRHNPTIMDLLRRELGATVDPVEAVGWNGDALEAQAFGFFAVRSLEGLPLSLPTTTGVPAPLTGGRLHQPGARAA